MSDLAEVSFRGEVGTKEGGAQAQVLGLAKGKWTDASFVIEAGEREMCRGK